MASPYLRLEILFGTSNDQCVCSLNFTAMINDAQKAMDCL